MGFTQAIDLVAHLEQQEKLHLLLIPRVWKKYSNSEHAPSYKGHKPTLFPGTPSEYNQYQNLRNDIIFSASPLLMALDKFRRSLTRPEIQLQHVLNQGVVQEIHDQGEETRQQLQASHTEILRELQGIKERLNAVEDRSKPLTDIDEQIAALKRKKAEQKADLKRKRAEDKAAEAAELKRKKAEEKAAARVAKNLERQANKKARKQESIDARLDNIDRMIGMYDLKEEQDVKAEPKPLKVKDEPNHLEIIELD